MIDVHTHFMRPADWGPEYTAHWKPGYGGDWPVITPEAFDEAMEGVDVAVVFGITARDSGVHTRSPVVREFIDQLKTPAVGFMALDPASDDWPDELAEGLEAGMVGVKLYPVLAHFDASERRHDSFYEALVEHGLPVLWHMGATLSPPGRLRDSHPLLVDDVATRHPELRQVIAHLGHPWQRDAVQVLRTNRNVYADISGIWTRPVDGFFALVNAQEWGVVDQLLFGSDYPLWTPQVAVDGLRAIADMELAGRGFPKVEEATVATILESDALQCLGIARPAGAAR